MLNKPKQCSKCVLGDYKGGFSQPEGTCRNGVLIIGEALGEMEKLEGLPFRPYAESGSALQTAINNLKKFGINQERQDFGLWNLVACQPPRNVLLGAKYEEEAVKTCRVNYFDEVIKYYKPKAILALGSLPVKWLVPEIKQLQDDLKLRIRVAKEAKDKQEVKYLNTQMNKLYISALRGYKFNSLYNIPLVASFHPSYINRMGRFLLGVLLRDLMFALEVADGLHEEFKFENYITTPSPNEAQRFYEYCKQNPDLVISYDIETPYTKLEVDESEIDYGTEVRDIDSIQFSVAEKNGNNGHSSTRSIFLRWDKDYINVASSILGLPNAKVGWNNWQFDETNLKYHLGNDALNGIRYDGMWLFKHMNSDFLKTGRALQFAANFYTPNLPAWKHLSELEPEKYGLIDVDATLRTFLGLKEEMSDAKLDAPKAKTLFEGYLDDVVKLFPIYQAIGRRGFPINLKEREEFRAELIIKQAQVLEELQEAFPTVLRRPAPLLGYKIVPKEVGILEQEFNSRFCDINSPDYTIFLSDKTKEMTLSRYIEGKSRLDGEEHVGKTGLVVKEFLVEGKLVKRYCRLDRFKPYSKPQVQDYIKYKKYKIKTKKQGKDETETTDKKCSL